MTVDNPAPARPAPAYSSGVAARLAGIPVETLRVWERRYRVIGPRRTPRGHRLYTADDVSRLTLIKKLVDLGTAIGSIADLSLVALREMHEGIDAASRGSVRTAGTRRRPRVALAGELPSILGPRASVSAATLEIVATCPRVADAADALRSVSADVVVIALPTLQVESLSTVDALIEASGARHAVVVYRFGHADVIGALRDRGHRVAHVPRDATELERLCHEAFAPEAPGTEREDFAPPPAVVPGRRFDDATLARVARSATTLYCECPRHLVDLLLDLGSFERYSAECANRDPADASLHRYLERVAGFARASLEEALLRVAQADGIALAAATESSAAEG